MQNNAHTAVGSVNAQRPAGYFLKILSPPPPHQRHQLPKKARQCPGAGAACGPILHMFRFSRFSRFSGFSGFSRFMSRSSTNKEKAPRKCIVVDCMKTGQKYFECQ